MSTLRARRPHTRSQFTSSTSAPAVQVPTIDGDGRAHQTSRVHTPRRARIEEESVVAKCLRRVWVTVLLVSSILFIYSLMQPLTGGSFPILIPVRPSGQQMYSLALSWPLRDPLVDLPRLANSSSSSSGSSSGSSSSSSSSSGSGSYVVITGSCHADLRVPRRPGRESGSQPALAVYCEHEFCDVQAASVFPLPVSAGSPPAHQLVLTCAPDQVSHRVHSVDTPLHVAQVSRLLPYLGTVPVGLYFLSSFVLWVALMVHTTSWLAVTVPMTDALQRRLQKLEVSLYFGIILGIVTQIFLVPHTPWVLYILDHSWPLAYLTLPGIVRIARNHFKLLFPRVDTEYGDIAFVGHVLQPFVVWAAAIGCCLGAQAAWQLLAPLSSQGPLANLATLVCGGVIGVHSARYLTNVSLPRFVDRLHGAAIATSE